jgi:signal transduction histidine kinase
MFFSAPVFLDDPDRTISAAMVHYGIMFGLMANILNIPALLLAGDPLVRILTTSVVLISALLLNLVFLRRGSIRAAGVFFLSLAWVSLAAVNYTAGGVRAPGFSSHIVLIICVGFMLGKRWAYLAAALGTALGAGFVFLESRGLLPPPQVQNASGRYLFISAANFFIVAAILTIMVNRLRTAIAAGRRELLVRQEAERDLVRHHAALEETVRERTEQVRAASRELEAFSYSVSHDLRAPLRAITGFANILAADYGKGLDDEGRFLLARITAGAARMDALINDLLAFSRLGREPAHREEIVPAEVVGSVLEELRTELAGRTVEVVVGELPVCRADPAMLRQVYANLLSNAFKYTRRQPRARVEAGFFREGDENVYFVRDNGAGFDMGHAAKLFGVFQRLHDTKEFEGTGVGLALVRMIVEKHGGRIWAQAAPGAGATFNFTLEPPKIFRR